MSDAILPLLIAGPILAAVATMLLGLRWRFIGWPMSVATNVAVLAGTAFVGWRVLAEDRLVHSLGGYPRAYGIELVADPLTVGLLALIGVVMTAALVFARVAGPKGVPFFAGFLLLIGGLHGVVLTGDLFNLFVFLEIVGLTTYALVAANRSGRAAYASIKYLILGTIGASLYLVGVAYAFLATGSLNMIELQSELAAAGHGAGLVRVAYALMFVGLALKIAQFPLHTWQPDAYQRAPDVVTIVMSALVSTVAGYALLRITFTAFTVEFLRVNPSIVAAIAVMGAISIVTGSALAAVQTELKRMFAYSSVAQFGMVVVAIAVANETAILGAMIHLVGHGLVKGSLFFAVGMLSLGFGVRSVDDIVGLGGAAPITTGGMTVLGFVLVGVPPSIGFIGKWYIAVGAIRGERWWVAAVILVSTLLTLSYVARMVERLFFSPRDSPTSPATDATLLPDGASDRDTSQGDEITRGMRAVLAVVVVVSVVLGFAGTALGTFFAPVLRGFFA